MPALIVLAAARVRHGGQVDMPSGASGAAARPVAFAFVAPFHTHPQPHTLLRTELSRPLQRAPYYRLTPRSTWRSSSRAMGSHTMCRFRFGQGTPRPWLLTSLASHTTPPQVTAGAFRRCIDLHSGIQTPLTCRSPRGSEHAPHAPPTAHV